MLDGLLPLNTREDTAAFFQVHVSTIDRLIRERSLQAVKLAPGRPGRVRIPRESILKLAGLVTRGELRRAKRQGDAEFFSAMAAVNRKVVTR